MNRVINYVVVPSKGMQVLGTYLSLNEARDAAKKLAALEAADENSYYVYELKARFMCQKTVKEALR
jgi:hypothetical protein